MSADIIHDLEYGRAVGLLSRDEYSALKAFGHSPAKAAEIILDATRGDEFSRRWIAMVMATSA